MLYEEIMNMANAKWHSVILPCL